MGGTCLTLVPLFNIPETFEDKSHNTLELRLKYYGQVHHLRKYGLDFKNKLESVGFDVKEVRYFDIVDESKRKLFGLSDDQIFSDIIFVCTK